MPKIRMAVFDIAFIVNEKLISAVCLCPLPPAGQQSTVFLFSELLNFSRTHKCNCFPMGQNMMLMYEGFIKCIPAGIEYFRIFQATEKQDYVSEYIVGRNWGFAAMELGVRDQVVCDGKMGFVFFRR